VMLNPWKNAWISLLLSSGLMGIISISVMGKFGFVQVLISSILSSWHIHFLQIFVTVHL
jgi:hypothetical protein